MKAPKRPEERLVEQLAKKNTELAINTLADICGNQDQPAAARVSAASALLDRGWGKPKQDIGIDGVGDLSGLSASDIAAELAALGAAAVGAEGGAAPEGAEGSVH